MSERSSITTHVLDTSLGSPARGVRVTLLRYKDLEWTELAQSLTDKDGRVTDLFAAESLAAGRYRLVFATREYYQQFATRTFYPEVVIDFEIASPDEHYHIPLLLSPFGYSTYRGS